MHREMTVKWLGHSCFKIECRGASLVIDPYNHVQGYPALKTHANIVLTSHGHGDHAYIDAVEIEGYEGPLPFDIKAVECFHDDCGGAKRGKNLIHVIKAGGMTAVHMGDLGHKLSSEQIRAIGPCDLVMIPVGGYYTIDAETAKEVCDSLDPRVIIPMHYRRGSLGFDVIGELSSFLKLFPGDFVRETGGDTFILDDDTPSQVAVLTFMENGNK
ncbi:MAG: MBL fold metallo-hydrolase [Clostridiaceae bacterium]|nr:MBL fold metallo-hydrolase [Clostridiaceae bacterium]